VIGNDRSGLVEEPSHLAAVDVMGIVAEYRLDRESVPFVEAHRLVIVEGGERQLVTSQFPGTPAERIDQGTTDTATSQATCQNGVPQVGHSAWSVPG
jgi:hypothetical protein